MMKAKKPKKVAKKMLKAKPQNKFSSVLSKLTPLRLLLFVLIFGGIGTAYLLITQAATLWNPMGISGATYEVDSSAGGGKYMSLDMKFEIANGTDGYYAAQQFGFKSGRYGGYMGLQYNASSGGKRALFSIWEAKRGLGEPGGNSNSFSGEGDGWQTAVPYEWQIGKNYRVTVYLEQLNAGNGDSLWAASVTDLETGAAKRIGRIYVPTVNGLLAGSNSFHERFSGATKDCRFVNPSQIVFSNFRIEPPARYLGMRDAKAYSDLPCASKIEMVGTNGYRSGVGLGNAYKQPPDPGCGDYYQLYSTDTLTAEQSLGREESISSPDKNYTLKMQNDSNLVVYKNRGAGCGPIWASNTFEKGGTYVKMQADSNLVIYNQNGAAIWNSSTYNANKVNPRLVMQNDGNLVIYNASNQVVWSTKKVTTTTAPTTTTTTSTTPTNSAITGVASNRCIDVPGSNFSTGAQPQLWDCNGTAAQKWTLQTNKTIQVSNKCLNVPNGNFANNVIVQLGDCNGSTAQQWSVLSDGTIRISNKCLDAPANTSGTKLMLYDCGGAANQRWTGLPANATQSTTITTTSTPPPVTTTDPNAGKVFTTKYYNSSSDTRSTTSQNIAFYWAGSPHPGINADYFMSAWGGYFVAPETGTYAFTSEQDDLFYLTINDVVKINTNWPNTAPVSGGNTMYLTKGQTIKAIAYHYDYTGPAKAYLYWSGPGVTGRAIFPKLQ